MIRLAFIGFGHVARKHLKILSSIIPDGNFLIISDFPLAKDDNLNSLRYELCADLSRLEEFNPHGVIISTHAGKRLPAIAACLKRHYPTFVEKPLAKSTSEFGDLLHKVCQTNGSFVVGYNLRFTKGLAIVREVIKGNTIGNIMHVHGQVGSNLSKWRTGRQIHSYPSLSREKGGGVLRELSHEIDLLLTLFGGCVGAVGFKTNTYFNNSDVEDVAHLSLKLGTEKKWVVASLVMDFVRWDDTRNLCIVGDEGTLDWDLNRGQVIHSDKTNKTVELLNSKDDLEKSYFRMWRSFLAKEFEKFCNFDDALACLEVIELIEKQNGEMQR